VTLVEVLAGAAGNTVGRVMQAAASPYPPSFDNNPLVFGWTLFARMIVLLLAVATLLRLRSRNKRERIPSNHPVYYHRLTLICFLWGAALSSGSDTLTYLFWGEVTPAVTRVVLLVSRVMSALTMVPFVGALFTPVWVRWLQGLGLMPVADVGMANRVSDARAPWTSFRLPGSLAIQAAVASAAVTYWKYWLWVDHLGRAGGHQ
jgi:hypothetical protein